MKMFESGGVLRVRPMRWREALRIAGIAATAIAMPPLVGIYCLVIA